VTSPTSSDRRFVRYLVAAAAVVVVLAGLRLAASLIVPLLLALFLALLSLPLLSFLIRHRVPRPVAVLLTIAIELALLTAFGLMVSGAVNEINDTAPAYLEKLYHAARVGIDTLRERGVDLSEWIRLDRINPAAVMDFAGGLVSNTVVGVAKTVGYVGLVMLTTIFLLFEAVGIDAKVERVIGVHAVDWRRVLRATRELELYLGIKTLSGILTGILVALWVAFLGLDLPLVWGLLAFILNYIPSLGSIVAAVPPVLLALVALSPGRALAVALGYLVVNVSIGNFLEPQLMGRRFGFSPLVVFLSLIFWGWLWGPIGMLLAVPMTMLVRTATRVSPHLRWVEVLLGPAPEPAGTMEGLVSPPPSGETPPRK